jgi:glycerophosphoryl diester phosphodiesterase
MVILSHRGYWKEVLEKNTRAAFELSFTLGFGTETDLRDRDGQLVISHDMANANSMLAEEFFEIYRTLGNGLPLALNIKADGLHQNLKSLLVKYEVENYFVFDMAVPDGLTYVKQNFVTYSRHSEFEPIPAYYEMAQGIWIDEFSKHWITDEVIEHHLNAGKSICIVSPELHQRGFAVEWDHYRLLEQRIGRDRLMLCTDFPEKAKDFFNGKN